MKRKRSISKLETYREQGEFWDSEDLAKHWDKTEPAEFELDFKPKNTCLPGGPDHEPRDQNPERDS